MIIANASAYFLKGTVESGWECSMFASILIPNFDGICVSFASIKQFLLLSSECVTVVYAVVLWMTRVLRAVALHHSLSWVYFRFVLFWVGFFKKP